MRGDVSRLASVDLMLQNSENEKLRLSEQVSHLTSDLTNMRTHSVLHHSVHPVVHPVTHVNPYIPVRPSISTLPVHVSPYRRYVPTTIIPPCHVSKSVTGSDAGGDKCGDK